MFDLIDDNGETVLDLQNTVKHCLIDRLRLSLNIIQTCLGYEILFEMKNKIHLL